MRYSFTAVIALATLAAAAPTDTIVVEKRQDAPATVAPKAPATSLPKAPKGGSYTSSQYSEGGCKDTVFLWARGSTEPGNVGFVIGPPLYKALQAGLGDDFAFEGVVYPAGIQTNFLAGGADTGGIANATKMFNEIHEKCPKSAIIAGGYSQGAALMHRTVEALKPEVQDHIAGVILYGDTKNKQDNGHIKNFPEEKSKVFCNPNDGVCGGSLNVNAGHLSYSTSIQPGANWLISRVQAWKKQKGIPDTSKPLAAGAPVDPPEGNPNLTGATPAAKGKAPKAASPKAVNPMPASPKPATPSTAPAAASAMTGMAGMNHGNSRRRA